MAGERRSLMQIHAVETQQAKVVRVSEESTSRESVKPVKANKSHLGDFMYYAAVIAAVTTIVVILIYAYQHGLIGR